jgi:hypothetical protein
VKPLGGYSQVVEHEGRQVRREQDGPERYPEHAGYAGPATTPGLPMDDPDDMGPPGMRGSPATQRLRQSDDYDDHWPEEYSGRREGNGAYWTGVVVLVAGLLATIAGLATHVTSIVQTILLAIPMVAVGIGLERVGRGVRRGSLRAIGGILILIAVASPVVLSVSSPGAGFVSTESAPVPAGTSSAVLRTSQGGGQLRVGAGAVGLYQAELRSPGTPSAGVSTSGKQAVVDLRGPAQHGLLARNRGSDWGVHLNSSVPWRIQAEAGALTGDLDLRQLDVRGVDVQAGISRMAVRVSQPSTEVPVNLQISTGLVDIYLPRSAACEIRVDGPALNNFSSQGLVDRDGAWRSTGTSGKGSFKISVRLSAGRVRVHRA